MDGDADGAREARGSQISIVLRHSCSAHSHTPITYSVSAIDESRRGSLCLQQRVCSSDAPAHRGPKPQQTSLVLYMHVDTILDPSRLSLTPLNLSASLRTPLTRHLRPHNTALSLIEFRRDHRTLVGAHSHRTSHVSCNAKSNT
jgi:hypothetical protein